MDKVLLIIKSRDLRVAQDLPSALYDRRITDFAAIHIGFGVYRNNIMIETDSHANHDAAAAAAQGGDRSPAGGLLEQHDNGIGYRIDDTLVISPGYRN